MFEGTLLAVVDRQKLKSFKIVMTKELKTENPYAHSASNPPQQLQR